MKTAVYDNNRTSLVYIGSVLKKYGMKNDAVIDISSFSTEAALIEGLEKEHFDLVLMDADEGTGISAASRIRSFDRNICMILYSSSQGSAVDACTLGIYGYLLKPVREEDLFPLLDRMPVYKSTDILPVITSSETYYMYLKDIEFVEISSKILYFNMTGGTVITMRGTLSVYEDLLLRKSEYVKAHRSYIANVIHIKKLDRNVLITDSGRSVPVSKSCYPSLKKSFDNFLIRLSLGEADIS